MNGTQRYKLGAGAGLVTMLLGALMVLAPGAGALDADVRRVTICHRTNSVLSPYVINTVSYNGANGEFVQGPNHYEHRGDIFDVEADPATAYPPPRKGDQWGDIIPPVPYGDGLMTQGLNWSVEGQAIYYGKTDHGPNDPALCTTPVAPPLTHTATLAKTNNADGVTDYRADETAPAAGADVPFKVVIANTGSGDLTVAELTDTWSDQSLDLLGLGDDLDCTIEGVEEGDASVLFGMEEGAVIPAGAAVTCYFTVEDYSPVAGGSVTNTVTLKTGEADDVIGRSIVRTLPTTLTYSATIAKANDADRNATYTGDEVTSPGAAVPFQVVISNTGTGPLTLVSLTDTWPVAGSIDLLGEGVLTCGEGEAATDLNVGDVIAARTSKTCRFTVQNYAPPAGNALTNTLRLVTDKTGPHTATSIVRTPGDIPSPSFTYSIGVDKQNDADADDDFSNFEFADAEGDDVEFEITIESGGTGAATLAGLTDTFGDEVVNLLTEADLTCLRLGASVTLAVGSLLPAGSTTVCRFTLEDYAPAPGEILRNVVQVDINETGPATDSSAVAVAEVLPDATGTVTLVKEVTGDANADWTFDFSGALGVVTLTDEAAQTPATPVAAGSHSIAEDVTDLGTGWEFSDATCVDQSDAVVGEAEDDGSVDFVVAPNADVTCTFVNEYTAPETAVAPTPPAVLGDVVTRPQALPRTGGESKGLAGAGVLLVALGAALVIGSKRQLAER